MTPPLPSSAPPGQVPSLVALPLVVETPRLRLRPIAEGDVTALFPFASDPAVAGRMSWDAHRAPEETLAFVRQQAAALAAGRDLTWAIEHQGAAIGCVGLSGITWQFRAWRVDRAELGYWLGPPFWGRGLASEAALHAARFGFERLGLHKITIGCVEGNAASQRIIEKLGFRFLAVAEQDFFRAGRWQGHRRYELTAAAWAARRT